MFGFKIDLQIPILRQVWTKNVFKQGGGGVIAIPFTSTAAQNYFLLYDLIRCCLSWSI